MKIEMSSAYQKGIKKCKKRNWDTDLLADILQSYVSKEGFDSYETIKYHDHNLQGNWKGHREFHPYGKQHNWVVVYHVEPGVLVLDATDSDKVLVLDDTGSHDEVFGEILTATH